MPSVIIPAHNEEALIADCLRPLLAEGIEGLQIIVVPNACNDRTAEIARGFAPDVIVIETETPGKTNALNLAEQNTTSFPRLFLDGDIVLKPGVLGALFAALEGETQIVAPTPEFVCDEADLGVRLFYGSLRANRYFGRGAPNGSGAFAVTEQGRERWGAFPDIIADDGFVELQFTEGEARTVPGPGALVRAPRTFGALLKIKTRARLGYHELNAKYPELVARSAPSPGRTLRNMIADPRLWPAVPVYGFVRVYERVAARRLADRSGFSGWLRDETSRTPRPQRETSE